MTPKNSKFYVWKEYFSFFQEKDKNVAITNAGKKKAK